MKVNGLAIITPLVAKAIFRSNAAEVFLVDFEGVEALVKAESQIQAHAEQGGRVGLEVGELV